MISSVALKRPEKDLAVFLGSVSPLLGALYNPICHGARGAELGGVVRWRICLNVRCSHIALILYDVLTRSQFVKELDSCQQLETAVSKQGLSH